MARKCQITNKRAQSGNNVSHSQIKTKRSFKANVQNITLHSDALNQNFKMKLAVSTLRSIDHNGGLDSYLLSTSNTELSEDALALKRKVKKAVEAKKAA